MELIAFILALLAILFETIGMGWVGSAFAFLTIIAIIACHIQNLEEEQKMKLYHEPAYDEDGTLLEPEYEYETYEPFEDPYDAGDFWNTRL